MHEEGFPCGRHFFEDSVWEEAGWILAASPLGCLCLRPRQDPELFPQTSTLSSLCDLGQGSSPDSVSLAGQ